MGIVDNFNDVCGVSSTWNGGKGKWFFLILTTRVAECPSLTRAFLKSVMIVE